jgi:hypothetical protein
LAIAAVTQEISRGRAEIEVYGSVMVVCSELRCMVTLQGQESLSLRLNEEAQKWLSQTCESTEATE